MQESWCTCVKSVAIEWWDSTTDNVIGTIRKYWIWLGRTTTTTYLPLKPVGMLLYAHLCVLLKTQLYLLLYVCYRKYIYQLDRYCILLATTTNLLQFSPEFCFIHQNQHCLPTLPLAQTIYTDIYVALLPCKHHFIIMIFIIPDE